MCTCRSNTWPLQWSGEVGIVEHWNKKNMSHPPSHLQRTLVLAVVLVGEKKSEGQNGGMGWFPVI